MVEISGEIIENCFLANTCVPGYTDISGTVLPNTLGYCSVTNVGISKVLQALFNKMALLITGSI